MRKLSKEKKQQLLLVVLFTAMALAGLGLLVIKPQWQHFEEMKLQKQAALQKLEQVKQTIRSADQIEAQLCEAKKRLDRIEDTMAAGDLYSWAIETIKKFKLGYKVEIPQFSQIDGPKPVNMLSRFPYQQAVLTIGGSARFYDFGKFLSDFENQFPYFRVMNLTMEPSSGLVSSDKERLAFKMEIAALVKPGA